MRRAALASVLPLSGDNDTNFEIEGRAAPASQSRTPVTWYRLVSAGYFEVMGIRLLRGRTIIEGEAAPGVVVNETFVRTYFPGEDPLGRRIRFGTDRPWFTIVGIVADTRVRGARESARCGARVYRPAGA